LYGGKRAPYKNHNTKELPSGFLVSSTPSLIPTGITVIEHSPMTTKMTKSAAVLCDFTMMGWFRLSTHDKRKGSREPSLPAQIRDPQEAAANGHKIHMVIPGFWIKMRSKIGNVATAARTPDRSITAPMRPDIVSE
jgi:hypothetical protein